MQIKELGETSKQGIHKEGLHIVIFQSTANDCIWTVLLHYNDQSSMTAASVKKG